MGESFRLASIFLVLPKPHHFILGLPPFWILSRWIRGTHSPATQICPASKSATEPVAHKQSRDAQYLANMFGITNKMLYSGSALFATTTAFIPVWISLALPIRHETVGPYNYHRVAKRAARLPWKRLPKAL